MGTWNVTARRIGGPIEVIKPRDDDRTREINGEKVLEPQRKGQIEEDIEGQSIHGNTL